MYCPSGFLASEDDCGNVIEGSWRGEDSSTALQPLRQLGGNRYTGTYATSLRIILFHQLEMFVGKTNM